MENKTVKRTYLGLALILLLAAGLRLLYLVYPIMDADQAINGIMARHILLGEFPVFFYGQEYCGSLENYLVAVVFLLCGASRFTLGLAIGLVSLFLVFLVFHLASRLLSRQQAWVAALLAAVPSGYFAFTSVLARSAYIETPLLGCLLFIVVGRLLGGDRRPVFYLLTGLVSGLAIWTHFLSVFYLAPAGLLLLIREKGFLGDPRAPVLLLAGALLGGLPFWIYNTIHPLATWHFLQGNPVHEPFQVSLKSFFAIRLPELLGMRDISGRGYYLPLASALVYGLVLAGLLYLLFLRVKYLRRTAPGSRIFTPETDLLLALLLFYPLIFSFSGFGAANTTRYLVPLYPLVPLLAAWLFFYIKNNRRRRIPAWIFLGVILASNAYGTYRVAVIFQPGLIRDYLRKTQIEKGVFSFLKEKGIKTVYVPDYWKAVPLTFAAREEIIFAQPLWDRYPPFTRIVDRSPRPAFLLAGDAPAFEATLLAMGGNYQKKRLGDLWLFFDVSAPPYQYLPLSPGNWQAYSNRGKVPVSPVVDRDLDTRWSLGRIMEAGDTFMLDLGRVWNDLGRITLLAGTREGLPRGLRLEISPDGRDWRTILTIPVYWDSLVWSGPHPFVRPERGALELVFTPQSGRYLKIVQTGADDRFAWEIAEVLVYRAWPSSPQALPAAAPRTAELLKRLKEFGIGRVQSAPWISAHLPPSFSGDPEPAGDLRVPGGEEGREVFERAFPAFVAETGQAEGLRAALKRENPGPYRELGLSDLTLFYAIRPEKGYNPLSRSGWRASANLNSREAWKALDGNGKSRWTSGAPQSPGMWFRLDLGHPVTVGRLRLALGESRRDFPRGLEIWSSLDGRNWFEVQPLPPAWFWNGEHLFREGRFGQRDFFFPDTSARYLELRQNGRDPTCYWSIHEIELFTGAGGHQ